MPAHTFHRQERLKSRTLIGKLFQEGNSFVAYPFKVVWFPLDHLPHQMPALEAAPSPDPVRAQVAFSVPKRIYKTAVARNRIKRRMREAYRLHKQELYDKLADRQLSAVLMLVYIAKEELSYDEILRGIKKMVQKI